jgi:NAD(P) transhydrogenase subunit alpha
MSQDERRTVIGVPRETYAGERRVSLIPAQIPALAKAGCEVIVEAGAGAEAGFPDADYTGKGAQLAVSRDEVFRADIIVQVRAGGANVEAGKADLSRLRSGQILIGSLDPLSAPQSIQELGATGATSFSLELLPRITRAQSMDILSAMATIAGYKAVLLAADTLPRIFPMLMTAAGTLSPAKVLIVGAGVAGLQAIATARRLGAIVSAYDVRPAVKTEVESLGARFVELPLEATDTAQAGGYAKQMSEDFYQKQRELMTRVVADSTVVITTAVIPGKAAPVLVTKEMVQAMEPGSVIVDLAAERGGNCELTRPGETTIAHGVTILGPLNLPATIPFHASQMYSKNMATFLLHLLKLGISLPEYEDEILRDTRVTHGGQVVHSRVRELLQQ